MSVFQVQMLSFASLAELVAMSVEFLLYMAHTAIWSKIEGKVPQLLCVFFFIGALFALSNMPFSIMGIGLIPWGGDLQWIAEFYQATVIYITPFVLYMLWKGMQEA